MSLFTSVGQPSLHAEAPHMAALAIAGESPPECFLDRPYPLSSSLSTLLGSQKPSSNLRLQQKDDSHWPPLQTVTFSVLDIGTSAIKLTRGVANEVAAENSDVLSSMDPNTALFEVALFVDHNKASMELPARTEL